MWESGDVYDDGRMRVGSGEPEGLCRGAQRVEMEVGWLLGQYAVFLEFS
jgi:hypothetical protein